MTTYPAVHVDCHFINSVMKILRGFLTFEGLTWLIHSLFCGCRIALVCSSAGANSEDTFLTNRKVDASSKFCGTYRAYPYVGMRCQYDSSPLMGLMWYQPFSNSREHSRSRANVMSLRSKLRHECTHDDHLDRFGWNQHDGKSYGRQDISDPQNQVNLTVQWVYLGGDGDEEKPMPSTACRQRPIRWALRIRGDYYQNDDDGNQDSESETHDLSLLWYVATPDNQTSSFVSSDQSVRGDHYKIWINPSNNSSHPIYMNDRTNTPKVYNATYFAAFQVPPSQHYNPKPMLLQELRNPTSPLPPHLFDRESLYRAETARTGNQVVLQVFFNIPFEVDYHFLHHAPVCDELDPIVEEGTKIVVNDHTSKSNREDDWERVTEALACSRDNFERDFARTFIDNPQLQQRRANAVVNNQQRTESISSSTSWSDERIRTAHYALSNMLSSITYMHGDRQVYDIEKDRIVSEHTLSAWTIVPDRPDHAQGK
jgi:Glycosyl hydrolase family 63 N-terminal domain/Glycosyl hydrolase family 63 C-terminal domain